ncbi:MAG: hypothetical protein QNJ15_04055 [Erythrobacter sp.]|nr:hypothetical protein [Erythrobacter sp.]
MTISSSTKFRAIGGASVLAIATGFSATAAAQVVTQPVNAVPTPTIPTAPANVEECALVTNPLPPQVVCAPGTDPDGFDEDFNSIDLIVEAGSQVQGEIELLVGVNATIDGDIVINSGVDSGLDLGANATVVNNGFIGGDAAFTGFIVTGADSTITNNGTVFNDGSTNGIGVNTGVGSTFTNSGLIAMQGSNVFGVVGQNAIISGDNVTVNNTITGAIIVDGQGSLSAGVRLGNNATVNNDGLIQTFGATAEGILVFDNSTITNTGIIFTTGDGAEGVSTGNDSTVINTGSGDIFTFGDNQASVLVGTNSTVQNNGVILSRGDSAVAVVAGDGSTVTNNPTGQIATTGTNSHAVVITGNATLLNIGGLIQAGGTGADGVIITGDATITNSGTVSTQDGRGVDIAGTATIDNLAGGVIGAAGGDAIRISGAGATLDNAGQISANGDGAFGVNALNDIAIDNSGTISTTGMNAASVFTGVNSTVTNSGTISASGDSAVALVTNDGSTITNTGTVSTIGTNAGAIVAVGNATITNDGTVSTLLADSTGITVTGDATLTNTGTIEATTARGVDIAGASTITNSGTISGGTDGIRMNGGTLTNTGTISGDTAVNAPGGAQTVFNFGAINGTTNALALGEDDDTFVKTNDATETGNVDGGTGNDVYAHIITDATDRTLDITAFGNTVTNFEDIRVGSQTFDFTTFSTMSPAATGVFTLTGTSAQGFTVVNTAILDGTANGTVNFITGASDGITTGFTITANGAIVTTGDGEIGFNAGDDAMLDNAGSITTSGMNTAGVLVGANSTVTNSGDIRSSGTSGVAIAAGDGSTITNAAGSNIITTGDNGFNTVIAGAGTLINDGVLSAAGAGASAVTITGDGTVTNGGILAAADGRAIDIGGVGTVANTGTIGARAANAIRFNSAGSTLTNDGTVITEGDGATVVQGTAGTTVANTGTITADGNTLAGLLLGTGSTVTNSGTISTTGNSAVGVAVADGSTVTNEAGGTVSTTGDNSGAVIFTGGGTITNDGTISTAGTDATALLFFGAATINNAGTISAAAARAIDLAAASTVNNDGTITAATDGIRFNAGSTLNNSATGSITGDTGVTGSTGDDTVVNFGTITGTTAAAALGDGADAFQQWSGAAVNGNVDLGGGDDTFVLEGANSTIAGMVLGGAGTDTAILGGTLDADNLMGFETNTLGTLFDLTVSGDRTLSGDVIIDGVVNLGLGVDTLTNDGTMTLESTGVINIATPLDEALIGQTVLVLQDGAGFTDNGATINILDDDLLIEYVPLVGSLRVQVNAVNPLVGSGDANFANFGGAVAGGIRNGTISAANFAALNGLASAAEFQTAAADALPSLSGGVSREVFESSNLASQALDRHLAAEGSGIWGQIAIRGSEQDAFSLSQDGFESDQTVITVGGDFAVGETFRVGVLASYADIEVEDFAGNVPQEVSDAESIKLGVYGAWTPTDRAFINMELAYLTGDVETARSGFFGPITSGYDFDGLAARVTVGYDLIADENVSLTPSLGINAADISFDDAAEAGGFGFVVERGDEVFIEGRAGIELGAQVSDKVDGFIQGTIIHDFADSPRSFRLSSAQLPTFTTSVPTPEGDRFELAAGVDVSVSDQFSIGLGYLGDFGGGYDAHSARATLRIGF